VRGVRPRTAQLYADDAESADSQRVGGDKRRRVGVVLSASYWRGQTVNGANDTRIDWVRYSGSEVRNGRLQMIRPSRIVPPPSAVIVPNTTAPSMSRPVAARIPPECAKNTVPR